MKPEEYKLLTPKEALFMDVLLDIARSLRGLQADITRDIEEMK